MPQLDFDTAQYEGEKLEEKKHGKGTLKFKDGLIFTGDFRDNHFERGILKVLKNGKEKFEFEGSFNDQNQLHGYGVSKFANGTVYKGMYLNNKRTGTGQFILQDKSEILSNFANGYPNGETIYIDIEDNNKRKQIYFTDKGKRQWTEREVKRKQCENNHWLQKKQPSSCNRCNICRGYESIQTDGFYRCSNCDFDRCFKCYDEYKI